MQWRDTTRYLRSEQPGRSPVRAWTLRVGHVRLTVVHDHAEAPNIWSLRTRLPGLRLHELHAQTAEEAQIEALSVFREWLQHQMGVLGQL